MQYRVNLDDVRTAAHGRWQDIHATIGIPRELLNTRKHQPCPHCGGKDRYRYTDWHGNGGFICNQCTPDGGSGFDLIMLVCGLDFSAAVQEVAQLLNLAPRSPDQPRPVVRMAKPKPIAPPPDKQAQLQSRYEWAQPLNPSDAACAYLQGRGVPLDPLPAQIRTAQSPYWASLPNQKPRIIGTFPAMIAAITLPDGTLQGLHYTYLQQDGQGIWRKLNLTDAETGAVLPAKKMFSRSAGALNGAAVHMAAPDPQGRLLVAEGVETALAARALFGVPAVAALSAWGMRHFQIPAGVKELYVCADHDHSRTGFQAANALAVRAIKQGIAAHIWQPPAAGCDALDEYLSRQADQCTTPTETEKDSQS